MNKMDSKEKITLREFMEQKQFKNFQFLRLYVSENWNDKVFMNDKHYKYLLDWKNKDYVSDEKGNVILYDSYYLGEYDNYLVRDFDIIDNICLNLMISLSEQEENFNLPGFIYKVPKIDKNTNLLFGNGITLEILKNSEFKKDYYMGNIIFRSLQVEKFKEYFDGKKLELNLHLHSFLNNECKKYKTLPIIKRLNANQNGNLFDLSTDVFYAYKYGYIDDIEDEDYIEIFIELLKDKIMNNDFTEDTCFDLMKNIIINSNHYNKDNITSFIKNTKKEFKEMMREIIQNSNLNFEIVNYILENEISHESLKLIEERVNNYENDFESWFIYSNLSRELMHLAMESIVNYSNSSVTKDVVKEILKKIFPFIEKWRIIEVFFIILTFKLQKR